MDLVGALAGEDDAHATPSGDGSLWLCDEIPYRRSSSVSAHAIQEAVVCHMPDRFVVEGSVPSWTSP